MEDLALIKSENFGAVQCDFYQGQQNEIWMTRRQIGESLEYGDPNQAIKNIHLRHKARLDKFSRVVQIETPSGRQETTLYSAKGVYEICRWSQQPKADAFYDWVYEILESLRKGETVLVSLEKKLELEIKKMNAEARLINARVRQAKLILKSQDGKTLSPVSVELLNVNALEALTDTKADYRPEIEKTYTATEIAKELGVSANKIGKIANANNLKTDEYGIMVLDKSPYSAKQVSSFRYNEKGRARLLEIIGQANSR